MMHRIFVYGTLKQGFHNHYLIQETAATYVGPARTSQRFPLVVGSSCCIPYLLYCPDHPRAEHVTGEVYSVNDATLATLDKLEAHPDYYQRDSLNITYLQPGGSTDTVQAYFIKHYHDNILELPMYDSFTAQLAVNYIPPQDRTEDTRRNHRYEVIRTPDTHK